MVANDNEKLKICYDGLIIHVYYIFKIMSRFLIKYNFFW